MLRQDPHHAEKGPVKGVEDSDAKDGENQHDYHGVLGCVVSLGKLALAHQAGHVAGDPIGQASREQDHFEREDHAFFERVRRFYLDLAGREPERFKIVDATLPLEQVWARVSNEISLFVERFNGEAVVGSDVG